jgi:hypothetical protein
MVILGGIVSIVPLSTTMDLLPEVEKTTSPVPFRL